MWSSVIWENGVGSPNGFQLDISTDKERLSAGTFLFNFVTELDNPWLWGGTEFLSEISGGELELDLGLTDAW